MNKKLKNKYFTIHKYALNIFNRNIKDLIERFNNSGRTCIMFGTSIIAEMIVNKLGDTPLDVDFIIDNAVSRQGMVVYGKKVYSPEFIKENFDDKYLILIASSYQEEMIVQLNDYGYVENKHIVKVIDLPELMEDYSYVDRTGLYKLSRDEIKDVQLGILSKIKECSKCYGIRYYLSSGTALGAVRHGGYIPWDDDVDVFLPIDDYLKLISILEKDDNYKIISQFNTDYYFGWGFGYMVDCNTICDINKFPIQLTTGQSIDLFPLYGIPDDALEKEIYIQKVKELENKCLVAIEDRERITAIKELNGFLLKYNYNDCKLVGNVLMPFFVKDVFPKNIFEEGVEKQFENLQLQVPKEYDFYLKQIYGDYMKLPPEEKRKGEHFYHTYYANKEMK